MNGGGRDSQHAWARRTALVTGVGGFIGGALAAELLRRGATVVGIIRDSAGLRMLEALGIHRRIDVVTGSISSPGLVHRVLNEYDVDTVFHLAAQTLDQVANRSPMPTFEANVAGTWMVLEAARLAPLVERVVIASCDLAYRDQPVAPAVPEAPVPGLYPYDASKLCADILAQSYATTFPLPVAIARCANVYGPGDLNWSRLIPGTVRSALAGSDPVVRSDGRPEREFLYLDDAIDGYLSVAEHLPEISGQPVNLGTGRGISVIEVVRAIVAEVGDAGLQPRILGEATREIDHGRLGYAAARAAIGWEPRTSLEQGLARTVPWYRDHLSTGRIITLGAAR